MKILNITYEIVVLINLLVSIYMLVKGKSEQQFHFYIYLSMVTVLDIIFPIIKLKEVINSNYLFFIFILISYLYFFYFFRENFPEKIYRNIWTLVFSVFFGITFILQTKYNFAELSSFTLALLPLFYIFGSMGWFVYILNQKVEGAIFDKMSFWISCGLLIWSVFFLFRGLPMYYFNNFDPAFLKSISMIFTMVNIITYSLFLRSLFCKK
ncbi:hypothetical protein [Chryseobacterium sp. YIM B08800]|uniref:hypothetical protein n=1 Tax=Chryseobacterium sp. YIM B08800 TaxID=2984136 RepID=UPI00223F2F7C|nr:hypothetical protein [Chryseobacterium sp. YIM B08800]